MATVERLSDDAGIVIKSDGIAGYRPWRAIAARGFSPDEAAQPGCSGVALVLVFDDIPAGAPIEPATILRANSDSVDGGPEPGLGRLTQPHAMSGQARTARHIARLYPAAAGPAAPNP